MALLLGGTDAFVSTPSTAAWNLSGTDFTIELDYQSDDWDNGGGSPRLASKDNVSGNGRSLSIVSSGNEIQFAVFNDAGSLIKSFASSNLDLVDTERAVIRIAVDIDDGAGGSEVKFYKGGDLKDTVPHTSPLTGVNVINPDGTTEVRLGARGDDSNYFQGQLHKFTVWTDLTQTTRFANPDFTSTAQGDWSGGGPVTDDEGNVWTVEGTDWSFVGGGNNLLLLGVG